uniref:uncharacterized protein LOC120333476 n=1 Tax=Styela clava TaxID=7725 RepID=UPI0019398D2E|nr:uncharacterized protein LOC120333476 [Styela clava]
MASRAEQMDNVQIAISDTNEFLQDFPSCFEVGSDSKLHHQMGKVNVFSHKQNFFADAYPEVLKVENVETFALLKQRLLFLPIYMHVHLERHRRSGNTRIITHGDYVIMVNTKQPDIQAQLREKLDEAEMLMREGKRFAVEFNFGPVLREWFQSRFDGNWGSYYARNSNFCITNFHQRSKWCGMPVCWILCLPVCLVVAPLHCAYRGLMSDDSTLTIRSGVTYVKGTTPAQRNEIRQLVRAAYIQGLSHNLNTQAEDRLQYEQAYNQMPAPPPSYTGQPAGKQSEAPPEYSAVVQQQNFPNGDDEMLRNVI